MYTCIYIYICMNVRSAQIPGLCSPLDPHDQDPIQEFLGIVRSVSTRRSAVGQEHFLAAVRITPIVVYPKRAVRLERVTIATSVHRTFTQKM